jgi:hypothetical protein
VVLTQEKRNNHPSFANNFIAVALSSHFRIEPFGIFLIVLASSRCASTNPSVCPAIDAFDPGHEQVALFYPNILLTIYLKDHPDHILPNGLR